MRSPLEAVCENDDGTAHEQVQWCPAWGRYLCSHCRYIASEDELRETLEQRRDRAAVSRG